MSDPSLATGTHIIIVPRNIYMQSYRVRRKWFKSNFFNQVPPNWKCGRIFVFSWGRWQYTPLWFWE